MEIKNIFVVGAGAMGTGIAQVAAQYGYTVYLNDISDDMLQKAVARIDKQFSSYVKKEKMTEDEKAAALARIIPSSDMNAAKDCQMVIEAASEKMEVKKSIFSKLTEICPEDAILASNTSSLSITGLAAAVKHPENFIGMHFFNPVPVMKLIEVISGLCTSDECKKTVLEFGKSLHKNPVEVKDGPGFLVNRILTMSTNEAVELLDQGYGSVEDIDTAMVYGCGHPMGPLTLIDMVGVDIMIAVMGTLYEELGDSKYRPALLLKKMVRAGLLGQKTGKGFYIYEKDGSKKVNPIFAKDE